MPLNIIQAYNLKKQFKGSKKLLNYVLSFSDLLLSLSTFYASFLIIKQSGHPYLQFSYQYWFLALLMVPTLIILLQTTNLARVPRTSRYISIFFDFVRFCIPYSIFLFVFTWVFNLQDVSTKVLLLYISLNLVLLYLARVLTYSFFKGFRSNGHNTNYVLLIADDSSETIIEKILNRKEWGFKVLFILSNSDLIRNKYGKRFRVLPDKVNFKNLIDIDIIDEVIYCKKSIDKETLKTYVGTCEETGVVFRLQNDLSSITYKEAELHHFEEIPLLTFMNTPSNQIAMMWKTITESAFSFITLIMLSPLLLLVSIAIKIESKGPVIFKQRRVGLRGRQFYIYKFRTMVANAEDLKSKLADQNESDGPMFKIKMDPRITPLGRILRKLSIDELPQLFNVLKGEMSLIGPRPPLPKEVELFERWQLRKLSMKPGITCTWQIIPNRNDVVFEKWMKLDIQYIETWSLKNDFKLIFKTIKSILTSGGY
jgi:exopolysaccharide biosynthesis polyprenyl glycosylphosphotransferase